MKNKFPQKPFFYTFFSLFILFAGCSRFGVYKIDVQQGNVVTQDMINQLRPGMTKNQVRYVMGTPLLIDTFDGNRWDYVYSQQPGGKERVQQRITIFFQDDKLTELRGDFKPEPPKDEEFFDNDDENSHTDAVGESSDSSQINETSENNPTEQSEITN